MLAALATQEAEQDCARELEAPVKRLSPKYETKGNNKIQTKRQRKRKKRVPHCLFLIYFLIGQLSKVLIDSDTILKTY